MHPVSAVFPAGNDLKLIVEETRFEFDERQRRSIDEIWEAETRRRGPNVYDNPVAIFSRREGDFLYARYMQYRELLAIRRDPMILPGREILTIGVNGIIVCEGRVLFAQRAKHVTEYPGYYEVTPSGMIDKDCLSGGRVDYRAQLAKELKEETGVAASRIRSIDVFALILDKKDMAYDIAISIELDIGCGAIRSAVDSSGQNESSRIDFVPLADAPRFIGTHRERVVPTTLAILEIRGII